MRLASIVYFLREHRLVYWGVFFLFLLALLRDIAKDKQSSRETAFPILAVLILIWGRFPSWLWPEQNADESQAIATAITFYHDPRYWLSVDTGSHGPLVSLPLVIEKLFGVSPSYAAARAIGTLMLGYSIYFCFDIGRRWFGPLAVKLAALPLILAMSFTVTADFVAYNGEWPILLCLAMGGSLADRAVRETDARVVERRLFASGVVLGLVPWIKLQGVPSAVIVAILVGSASRHSHRRVLAIAGGFLLPTLIFMTYVIVIGAFRDFVHGYLAFAVNYIERDSQTWTGRLSSQFEWILLAPMIDGFIGPAASSLFFLLLGCFSGELRTNMRLRQLGIATLLFMVAGYEVYRPGNRFVHYLLLFSLPMVLMLAGLLQAWLATLPGGARPLLFASYCAITTFWPLSDRLAHGTGITGVAPQDPRESVGRQILRYAHSDDRLVVWGWEARFHVFTRLRQGVRYAVMWGIEPPRDPVFMNNLISDFDAAPVPVFLESVSESSFKLRDRSMYGIEQFPQIDLRIRRDYELVYEEFGMRLFVRKDRLAQMGVR